MKSYLIQKMGTKKEAHFLTIPEDVKEPLELVTGNIGRIWRSRLQKAYNTYKQSVPVSSGKGLANQNAAEHVEGKVMLMRSHTGVRNL